MNTAKASLVLFTEEFLCYVAGSQGLEWIPPERDIPAFLNRFRPEFAVAALFFAKAHKPEFDEMLAEVEETVFTGREEFLKYVYKFGTRIFKGNMPLMEFIAFCGFAADLAIIACKITSFQYVAYLAEAIIVVFEENVEPYFSTLGGWMALNWMAEQYIVFMRPSPQKQKLDEVED